MQQLILKDSEEWAQLLRNLNWSKQKSNRDVLCLKCWKIMKYEECVKHKMLQPDHIKSILTSKEYAQEGKFIAVARALGKVRFEENGGKEFYENPYKTKDRRGRPPAHISIFNDEFRRQKEFEGGFSMFSQSLGFNSGANINMQAINGMQKSSAETLFQQQLDTQINLRSVAAASDVTNQITNSINAQQIPTKHDENFEKQLKHGFPQNITGSNIHIINAGLNQGKLASYMLNGDAGSGFDSQNMITSAQMSSHPMQQRQIVFHPEQQVSQNPEKDQKRYSSDLPVSSIYQGPTGSGGEGEHKELHNQYNFNNIQALEHQVDKIAAQISNIRKNQTASYYSPAQYQQQSSNLKLNSNGQLQFGNPIQPNAAGISQVGPHLKTYFNAGCTSSDCDGQSGKPFNHTSKNINAQYQSLNQSTMIPMIINQQYSDDTLPARGGASNFTFIPGNRQSAGTTSSNVDGALAIQNFVVPSMHKEMKIEQSYQTTSNANITLKQNINIKDQDNHLVNQYSQSNSNLRHNDSIATTPVSQCEPNISNNGGITSGTNVQLGSTNNNNTPAIINQGSSFITQGQQQLMPKICYVIQRPNTHTWNNSSNSFIQPQQQQVQMNFKTEMISQSRNEKINQQNFSSQAQQEILFPSTSFHSHSVISNQSRFIDQVPQPIVQNSHISLSKNLGSGSQYINFVKLGQQQSDIINQHTNGLIYSVTPSGEVACTYIEDPPAHHLANNQGQILIPSTHSSQINVMQDRLSYNSNQYNVSSGPKIMSQRDIKHVGLPNPGQYQGGHENLLSESNQIGPYFSAKLNSNNHKVHSGTMIQFQEGKNLQFQQSSCPQTSEHLPITQK